MQTVKDLLNKLNFALDNGFLKEDDYILAFCSDGTKIINGYLTNVCLPKLKVKPEFYLNSLSVQLGFTESIFETDDNDNSNNKN